MASIEEQHDEAELNRLGYAPVLARTMGLVRATMVNISTSSVTTAMFTLFALGLYSGGTAFVWSYAVGFIILLAVTAMFAELGSSMPIAGALYPWASRLIGPRCGYAVGWLYIAAQTAITAAVAYGIAPYLASMLDFELSAQQTTIVAIVIVLVSTLVNVVGVAIASGVASVGAIAEVIGMIVIIIVLLIAGWGNQSPSVLVESHGLPEGSSFLPIALATMLFGSWAYTGLEMSADMAEETKEPSRVIPRAAIASISTTFIIGMAFLIAAVLAIPDLDAIFASANPLQDIIEGNTAPWFYKAAVAVVIVAVFVATVTNQALTARALFALARDRKVPGAGPLTVVPKSTQVPTLAIVVIGVLASVLLMFTGALAVIAVACLTALFTCYMIIVWAQLVARVRGTWTPDQWSLGKLSMPINVLAAVLGTALTINVGWPRGDGLWYERWSGFAFTGLVLGIAVLFYVLGGKRIRAAISAPPGAPISPAEVAVHDPSQVTGRSI